MTSEEQVADLRKFAALQNEDPYGNTFIAATLSDAADTIERLQRENEELKETIRGKLREVVETAANVGNTNVQLRREVAEAERLLKRTSRFLQARELADGDLYADIDSHLSRTARHEGT